MATDTRLVYARSPLHLALLRTATQYQGTSRALRQSLLAFSPSWSSCHTCTFQVGAAFPGQWNLVPRQNAADKRTQLHEFI